METETQPAPAASHKILITVGSFEDNHDELETHGSFIEHMIHDERRQTIGQSEEHLLDDAPETDHLIKHQISLDPNDENMTTPE